jgi:hypothetical protein
MSEIDLPIIIQLKHEPYVRDSVLDGKFSPSRVDDILHGGEETVPSLVWTMYREE